MSAIYQRSTAAWCVSLKGFVPGLLVTLTLLTWACLLAPQATKASGVVTNCTEAALRAALTGGGTVTFACDGTIVLSSTIVISNDTVIDATGRFIALNGNNSIRILNASHCRLAVTNVTVTDGAQGGIHCFNVLLRVSRCTFTNNGVAGVGGAALNYNSGIIYNSAEVV